MLRLSWPHAAKISSPRGLRTKQGNDRRTISWKLATRAASGVRYGISGPGFSAIRFTLAFRLASRLHHASRIGVTVVYALQQHVLEGELLPRPQRIGPARLHQVLQVIFARDGHQLAARLLGGSVERNGQLGPHRRPAQLRDPRHDPRRRNRDAPRRKAEARRVQQDACGFQHILQIEQRLALPHHHDVQAASWRPRAPPQHLARRSRPAVRLRSRPSSAVMQNLQSTAQPTWLEMQMVSRSPSGMQHGLDGPAVLEPQQVAPRAVDDS